MIDFLALAMQARGTKKTVPINTMEKLEPKIEKPKIKNLYQLLDFLEGEFGENVTKELFKHILEQRALADLVCGNNHPAKEERIKRLKGTEVTPVTVAKLNNMIDIRSKSLKTELRQMDLRDSERLEKNIREEKEEMLKAIKDKEIVIDGKENIEVKIQ